MKPKTIFNSLLFAVCSLPAAAQDNWSSLVPWMQERMNEWHIPGAALVVVKGDSVLFKHTFGYADVETKQAVNDQTLFAIGSCTKTFTATGMLLLQDAEKVDLMQPVKTYYPALHLQDTLLEKQLTIQDILSHRSGLERGDYIFYGSGYSREAIIDRLQYLKPVAPLRTAFIYNNLLYTLAGTVIEKQSGQPYETFITQRLLQPIGMQHTAFATAAGEKNKAYPYRYYNAALHRQPVTTFTGLEPAGGLWSDINDMSRWVRFLVAGGKADTTRLLSRQAAMLLKMPVGFTGNGMRADESEFKSYGLGMGFTAYKGHRVMYHTGVADGYMTHLAVLPEEKIGIVLLCNTETFTNAIINNVIDRAMNETQTDWNSDVLAYMQEQWAEEAKTIKAEQQKINGRKPLPDAAVYTGVFTHRACRPVELAAVKNNLELRYAGKTFALLPEEKGVFTAYDPAVFGKIEVRFVLKETGKPGELHLMLMGEDLLFQRQASVK